MIIKIGDQVKLNSSRYGTYTIEDFDVGVVKRLHLDTGCFVYFSSKNNEYYLSFQNLELINIPEPKFITDKKYSSLFE